MTLTEITKQVLHQENHSLNLSDQLNVMYTDWWMIGLIELISCRISLPSFPGFPEVEVRAYVPRDRAGPYYGHVHILHAPPFRQNPFAPYTDNSYSIGLSFCQQHPICKKQGAKIIHNHSETYIECRSQRTTVATVFITCMCQQMNMTRVLSGVGEGEGAQVMFPRRARRGNDRKLISENRFRDD